MKTKYIIPLLLWLLCFGAAQAHIHADSTLVLKGKVIDTDTKKPLMYASVSVKESNISTVTNQDGYFSLRVPMRFSHSQLAVRHLGYKNQFLPLIAFAGREDLTIRMSPSAIQLSEIEVLSGDGRQLMRKAISRITKNYAENPEMMVAFYRESIKKGSRYLSLVEAVLDVYKASYKSYSADQARIYIGRKATDIHPRDTLFMKFQGGISSALLLDIAKNTSIVFENFGEEYNFTIERMIQIDDKPHYAIAFAPREGIEEILFRGTVYLDAASLAFSRMDFYMNVENRKDAAELFVKKKPRAMRVKAEQAKYSVNFVEHNGKWYFNYCSMEVQFKVRWKNRFFGLFSSTYTIGSEMAITDRYAHGVTKFPRKERIRSTDIIAEKVEHFIDPHFWGDYNVIEPDIEITNAIKKLSGKLQRREN